MEFALNVPFAATLVNYANVVSAAIIFILSKVSFENPAALAPRLAVCGALALGVGAIIRGTEREEQTEVTRSIVVSALGSERRRAKNTWPRATPPTPRAHPRAATLRARAVQESRAVPIASRAAVRSAPPPRRARRIFESSASRRSRFAAQTRVCTGR
jgi:hypothetical protein